jgi:hypothetical protein
MTRVMIYYWDSVALDVMESITGDTRAEIIEDALALYMTDRGIKNEVIDKTNLIIDGRK